MRRSNLNRAKSLLLIACQEVGLFCVSGISPKGVCPEEKAGLNAVAALLCKRYTMNKTRKHMPFSPRLRFRYGYVPRQRLDMLFVARHVCQSVRVHHHDLLWWKQRSYQCGARLVRVNSCDFGDLKGWLLAFSFASASIFGFGKSLWIALARSDIFHPSFSGCHA